MKQGDFGHLLFNPLPPKKKETTALCPCRVSKKPNHHDAIHVVILHIIRVTSLINTLLLHIREPA